MRSVEVSIAIYTTILLRNDWPERLLCYHTAICGFFASQVYIPNRINDYADYCW